MSARVDDAVAALQALTGAPDVDLSRPAEAIDALRPAAHQASVEWERLALATRDADTSRSARRWVRAIDAVWELARHELAREAGTVRKGELP